MIFVCVSTQSVASSCRLGCFLAPMDKLLERRYLVARLSPGAGENPADSCVSITVPDSSKTRMIVGASESKTSRYAAKVILECWRVFSIGGQWRTTKEIGGSVLNFCSESGRFTCRFVSFYL